jgi:hypothetical protein
MIAKTATLQELLHHYKSVGDTAKADSIAQWLLDLMDDSMPNEPSKAPISLIDAQRSSTPDVSSPGVEEVTNGEKNTNDNDVDNSIPQHE